MARKTTPTSGRKPSGVTRGAKPAATKSRSAGAAAKTVPARKTPAPAKAAPARAGRPAAARAPMQSKQELRDRIEKLERANVVLRAKNREAIEASREAANRIDHLEEQLSKHAGAQPAPEAGQPAEQPADEVAAKPVTRRGRKPKAKSAAADLAPEPEDEEV